MEDDTKKTDKKHVFSDGRKSKKVTEMTSVSGATLFDGKILIIQ